MFLVLLLSGITLQGNRVEEGAPKHDHLEKVILINLTEQESVYKEDGKVIWRSRVSTGREGKETRTGKFDVSHKHRDWVSTIYGVEMPYFLRFSGSDFGMHEGKMGWAPGSAGCIRLPGDKAKALFKKISLGTPVLIYGKTPSFEKAKRAYWRAKRNPRLPSSQRILNP